MMRILIIIIATTLLTLTSCSSGNKNNESELENADKETIVDERIVEKYWKLKILDGQKVEMAENQEREMYFMLKANDNHVSGFSGCNTFSGSYTLDKVTRIRFSRLASTMRACPDVNADESKFLEVFELADNYTIEGDTLRLNVGRRSPLAVFEAVYFE